jgi:hypothetical protein
MNSIFYHHSIHAHQKPMGSLTNPEGKTTPSRSVTPLGHATREVEETKKRGPGIKSSGWTSDYNPLIPNELPVSALRGEYNHHIASWAKRAILAILFILVGLLLLNTFVRWSMDVVALSQVPSMISYYNERLTVCATNYAITRDSSWIAYYNGNASAYYHYIHGLKWMLNDYSHTNFMSSIEDVDHSLRSTEQLVIQGGVAPDSNFPLTQVSYQYHQHRYHMAVEELYENIDSSVSFDTTFYGATFVLSEFLLACAILILCTRMS